MISQFKCEAWYGGDIREVSSIGGESVIYKSKMKLKNKNLKYFDNFKNKLV